MDQLLSGEQGWDTDMDESDDEVNTKHYSQPTGTMIKSENRDNLETLEYPIEAVESQWRLCKDEIEEQAEELAEEIESEDEKAKATNKESNSNLLAYQVKLAN